MSTGTFNFPIPTTENPTPCIKRGDTWLGAEFQYKVDGEPKDITDIEIHIQMYDRRGALKYDWSIGSGITRVDAVLGKWEIDKILRVDAIEGILKGDIQFTEGGEDRITIANIELNIVNDITK